MCQRWRAILWHGAQGLPQRLCLVAQRSPQTVCPWVAVSAGSASELQFLASTMGSSKGHFLLAVPPSSQVQGLTSCLQAPKGAEQHTGAYPEAQPPAGAAPPARPPHQDEVDDLLSVLQDLEGSVPSSLLQFTARSGGPGAPPSAPVAEQRAEQAAEPPAAGPGLPGDADLLRAVAAMGASQGRRNFRLPPLVPGMGLNRAAAANGGAANSNTAWASMQPGPAPAVLAAQQQQQQDQPPAEGKAAGGATGYANYEMDRVASAAFAFFPSPKWEDAPAAAAQGQPQQPEPTRLAAGVTDGSLGTAPHPGSPADRPSPFQAAASPAAGPAAAAAAEDGSGSEVSGLPAAPLREARAPSSVEEGLDTGQPGGSGSGKEDARREKARLASRQFRARQVGEEGGGAVRRRAALAWPVLARCASTRAVSFGSVSS